MTRGLGLVGAVVIVLVIGAHASAGAYRWVDSRGVVHYADVPPQPSAIQDPPDAAAARTALLDQTLKALAAGDFDTIVARYRLFDESRDPQWVAENRRLLTRYFTLLRSGLGRPTAFQRAEAFAPGFQVDPVPDRFWDQSDCAAGQHAYQTTLVDREQRRVADLFVRTCYAVSSAKAWLRSVTILIGRPIQTSGMQAAGVRLPAPDAAFVGVMTRFTKEMTESCERYPLMDSCRGGVPQLTPVRRDPFVPTGP